MKKILLWIILFTLMATPVWSASYYGCASANINADSTFCATPSGSCAGSDAVTAATALAGTHTLYANGCTVTINASFTATKISTADGDGAGAAVAGGNFAVATSTSPLTITSSIEAGASECLTITGSANANPALTIAATTIVGGSTANDFGIGDAHTTGTVVITATTITGGSYTGTSIGYRSGGSGATTITGNCVGGSSSGCVTASTNNITITGDCIGSDSTTSVGCEGVSTGLVTVVGNLIWGVKGPPARDNFAWTPAASNYVKTVGGTDVYASQAPAKNKVLSDTSVVISTTGAYEAGTAASGGTGGSYGF